MIPVHYAVTVLAKLTTNTPHNTNFGLCDSAQAKPPTASLGRDGTVGLIFPTEPVYGGGAKYLLVRHADGSTIRLSLPSVDLLQTVFSIYGKVKGHPQFQDLYFSAVKIADDGTPFATVNSHFWGGGSGIETAAFRWAGSSWRVVPTRNLLPPLPNGGWPVNLHIATAESSSTAAFNGVYGEKVIPDIAFLNDPTYQLNRVEVEQQGHDRALGPGTATAMSAGHVVGFRAGLNAFGGNCGGSQKTTAVDWAGAIIRMLGPGIAYDVNAREQIVGDNGAALGIEGYPAIWQRSTAAPALLDARRGTAFAINDAGVIVGIVAARGFVADGGHPKLGVTLLDSLLTDHSWSVNAAYGVSRAGNILAYAHKGSGQTQIVLLEKR